MVSDMQLPRRQFIKILTFGTATSLLGSRFWQQPLVAECSPLPGQVPGSLSIRLADYPALNQEFGSVRIGINPISGAEPFPDGSFYPILINRDGFGAYHVLDCECKHANCVVPAFDSVEFVIRCPCHGSEYDIDGSVKLGPTQSPLTRYPFTTDGQANLTAQIPCWGFQANLTALSGGSLSRLRLNFPTFPQVSYEVSFREKPQDSWTLAPFSSTPGGAANQTSYLGDGSPVSLYLDCAAPAGCFAVGMRLREM